MQNANIVEMDIIDAGASTRAGALRENGTSSPKYTLGGLLDGGDPPPYNPWPTSPRNTHVEIARPPSPVPSATSNKDHIDEVILVSGITALFTTLIGIAESIVYAIYYSNFPGLLPLSIILVPIVGGGGFQLFLALLAYIISRGRHRAFLFLCAFTLLLSNLAAVVIPSTSLGLNSRAASDTNYIVSALLASPPSTLAAYGDRYQSCMYDIPDNQTQYSPIDIAPPYLNKSCRYTAIACNVPVQSCYYSYRVLICSDTYQLQSGQYPCNTLGRVAYQIQYDWNKMGKMVDGWAIGVWGFWLLVAIVYGFRSYVGL